jgi:general secretion pathway protein N
MEGHEMMLRAVTIAAVCCMLTTASMNAMAATSPDDAMKPDVDRGTIDLDRSPAAREQVTPSNPLWAIPLKSLTKTRERPLFTPSRRPPAPAVIAVPHVAPPKIVVRPTAPQRPNMQLIGTVISDGESIGVFLDQTSNVLVRLKTGEGHSGWILRSIKAREATLEKESQKETLRLPAPK